MADLLVNVPQMQRDLQRAREDNAYLRTLLKQINVEDAGLPPSPPQNTRNKAKNSRVTEEDADFNRALARRQARLDSATTTSGASATGLELKSANDRVALLERQLLDAEETICHLKAEKLAALRDVERLNAAATEGGRRRTNKKDDSEQQRKLVLELETRLAEQKQAHALEQEQRMAVIRDQESELKTLRGQLEEKTNQYKELQQRHMDLLEMDDQATAMMKQRVTSGVSQFSIYGEESDDDEAKVTKPQDNGGRARAPADADAVNPKWQEELVRHPTPHFDLESPEVAYILRAWTKNIKKMRYLRRWLIQVVSTKGPLPDDFPMGVELPRLPPEVRDGFLTLVLPLLRKQTDREILAHSRRYNDGIHTDLRFRVVPRE